MRGLEHGEISGGDEGPQRAISALVMWTIYDHPSDAPDAYVARKWLIGCGDATGAVVATGQTMTEKDIDTLRTYFQLGGLHRLPRQPGDDPVIVESWL